MKETKNTLMSRFIKIREMQRELDLKKKEYKTLGSEVKSLAQKIPVLIRELDLK